MRFPIADVHIGALVLSGRMTEASLAAEQLRQEAADLPGAAQLFSDGISGRAALGAGRLDSACSLLAPVVELLSASGEANGVAYFYLLQYTLRSPCVVKAMRPPPRSPRSRSCDIRVGVASTTSGG